MGHLGNDEGGFRYPEEETVLVPLEKMIFFFGFTIGAGVLAFLLLLIALALSLLGVI